MGKQSVAYADLSNAPQVLLPRLVNLLSLYENHGYLKEADALLEKAEYLLANISQQDSNQALGRLEEIVGRLQNNARHLVID